jgi:Holliday junction DNA helicase RuvA
MIARLLGELVSHQGNRGIIDVAGVGYEVFAPGRCLTQWASNPIALTAFISTQVREDSITLYAFSSDTDREAFCTLLSVSGVGPKVALACLNGLDVDTLDQAIQSDDLVTLSGIPGVGKKTAQRLALELKGKLPTAAFGTPRAKASSAPADPLPLALARLGYKKSEIDRALQALAQQNITAEQSVSERLAASLRILSGIKA